MTESELQELTALEEDLWRRETRFNHNYMREIMAPDFFEFGRSGRAYTIEETLSIEAQDIEAEIPLPDLKIRQLSEDVVQITYNSRVNYHGDVERARRSSIWTRSDGKWQIRFHQGTPYTPNTE